MGTNENTQEMTETRGFDLPREDFQLTDHPWLALIFLGRIFS